MGCIYKAINTVNGKAYIGQTINTMASRKRRHHDQVHEGRTTPFHRAIRKYGKKAFVWECLIDNVETIEELNILEIEYIAKYDTLSPKGYNLQLGGQNGLHSEETKQKMGITRKQLYSSVEFRERNLGKPRSIALLAQDARTKAEHGNLKAVLPRQSKRNASGCIAIRKNADRGIKIINKIKAENAYNTRLANNKAITKEKKRIKHESDKRIRDRLKAEYEASGVNKPKKVMCIDSGVTYDSIHGACKDLHMSTCQLRKVCNGKGRTIHGLSFKYA